MKLITLFILILVSLLPLRLMADQVKILETPEKSLAARIKSIQKASQKIYIETFYLENDELGNFLINSLINKKKNNSHIDIKLLLDAYGSSSMHKGILCFAISKGIQIKKFNPINKLKPRISQKRDHRKIWLTENTFIIGGRNLSMENFDPLKWDLDVEFSTDQLPKVEETFGVMWEDSSNIDCSNITSVAPNNEINKNYIDLDNYEKSSWHTVDVELIFDYGLDEKPTYHKFINQLKSAEQKIIIETGFFTPNNEILNILKNHSEIGTEVKITTNGPYFEYWIGTMTTCASLNFQKEILLNNDSQLYYPSKKYSTHSKILFTDDDTFSFGSFNVHQKSFLWNAETLVTLKNLPTQLKKDLQNIIHERLTLSNQIFTIRDTKLNDQSYKNRIQCHVFEKIASQLSPFI